MYPPSGKPLKEYESKHIAYVVCVLRIISWEQNTF